MNSHSSERAKESWEIVPNQTVRLNSAMLSKSITLNSAKISSLCPLLLSRQLPLPSAALQVVEAEPYE